MNIINNLEELEEFGEIINTTLINGDCLKAMEYIPSKSIDAIICDLPYGTTASSWDKILDFNKLWKEYERVIKDEGAIVLFASGQFTNKLINSNIPLYRYKWIWIKSSRGNFVNAKNRPMTAYEEVCVFSKGVTANGGKIKMNYYPQGLIPCNKIKKDNGNRFGTMAGKRPSHKAETLQEYTNYPCDLLDFKSVSKPIHPTEKPVDLLEYLVRTYTKEGDLVLDNCCGVGSTLVACQNSNRRFIGIELEEKYFNESKNRLK